LRTHPRLADATWHSAWYGTDRQRERNKTQTLTLTDTDKYTHTHHLVPPALLDRRRIARQHLEGAPCINVLPCYFPSIQKERERERERERNRKRERERERESARER